MGVVVSPTPTATVVVTHQAAPMVSAPLDRGPKGDPGQPGVQGPPGSAGGVTHQQLSPLAVWTISHNLGRYPSVTVYDSSGAIVFGDIVNTDVNNLTITFSAAFGGTAYLV